MAPNTGNGISPILSRATILSVDDFEITELEVEEWGGVILLRPMTACERDDWELKMYEATKGATDTPNMRNIRSTMICKCAVDADGEPLFTAEDIEALGEKNAKPVQIVFDKCQEINGMRAEDIAELAGNSEAGPKGSSSST